MPNTYAYTPYFVLITGSQAQIPAGAKRATINFFAGTGFINGSGGFTAGMTINMGNYDGRHLLRNDLNIGLTGGSALVYFEV